LEVVEGAALLPEALEELSTALEELRVTDEQLQAHQEQLTQARQMVETERDQYRDLFESAPAAYLVTDRVGVIQQANRQAAGLLGVAQQFLVGRPLAMFVVAEDRWALRDRLGRGGGLEGGSWQLRLQPRRHEPVPAVVATSVIHDQEGAVTRLRWVLLELPSAAPAARETSASTPQALPALLAELVTSRPAGRPALTAVPSSAPDWDNLAAALSRVVRTAVPLLRADAAGLMLADHDGMLYGVSATDDAEQAFEGAQRDLEEGPCVDAYTSGQVVWTADLWADPRWSRLGPAAKTNQIRGVLVS
ncbi:MAG TPA: PAS domain S-box protein, partial [Solirubrobacteraceae bacterium]|nr:PAS domain S-box protein [Solirubrobacteraceae bacterium]